MEEYSRILIEEYCMNHTSAKSIRLQKLDNIFFINGTAYAGKSTMVKRLAEKYNGIACEDEAWVRGVAKECETLELHILNKLNSEGKMVFVDTNISIETLKEISDNDHVLIMLADPDISVNCFFNRPDNFLHSGFRVIVRDESRSIEDTFALVEKELGLQR